MFIHEKPSIEIPAHTTVLLILQGSTLLHIKKAASKEAAFSIFITSKN